MFRFENEHMLYWLLIIPIWVLVLIIHLHWKHHSLLSYAQSGLGQRLTPDFSKGKIILKNSLLIAALTCLIVALANPQMGSKLAKVQRKGVDLMLCLDVSNSMNAQDIEPSRLQRSKLAIHKLLEKLGSDRIGIVVFAGEAYTQLPLTNDYGAAKLFVDVISTDDIATQGTAIGAAIHMALDNFEADDKSKNSRAIIIVSDGENHEDDALEAAKEARSQGVIVNTIGMGLPEGAPIPVLRNGQWSGYKQNPDGSVVVSQLNEQMLQDIAKNGDGTYVRANNTSAGIEAIFDRIAQMEKRGYEARNYSDYESRFYYPLTLALILLLIELCVFERKNKYLNHQTLFSSKQ